VGAQKQSLGNGVRHYVIMPKALDAFKEILVAISFRIILLI
jgi:hypothetical protein